MHQCLPVGQHTTEAPPPLDRPDGPPDLVARDEAHWRRVAAHYRVSGRVTNLDAGYWGMMPVPVRYLRDRWVGAVRGVPGLDILTPDDRQMAAAITSFQLRGRTSGEDNQRIVDDLLNRYGLFTVRRTGLEQGEQGDCVRVTPALYNGPADVDRLVVALTQLSLE